MSTPLDDLVDDLQIGFIVLDNEQVVIGHRVAAGRRLVAAHGRAAAGGALVGRPAGVRRAGSAAARRSRARTTGNERRRLTDTESIRRRDRDPLLTDVDAQERPDHAEKFIGAHVVEPVHPRHDLFAFEDLGVVLDFSLGVEIVDRPFFLFHQTGQLDHRLEHLVDGRAFEVGRDRAADLGRDQDVESAAAAEQLEQLPDVELVDVHRHQAVAIELDLLLGGGRGRAGRPAAVRRAQAGLCVRNRRRWNARGLRLVSATGLALGGLNRPRSRKSTSDSAHPRRRLLRAQRRPEPEARNNQHDPCKNRSSQIQYASSVQASNLDRALPNLKSTGIPPSIAGNLQPRTTAPVEGFVFLFGKVPYDTFRINRATSLR